MVSRETHGTGPVDPDGTEVGNNLASEAVPLDLDNEFIVVGDTEDHAGAYIDARDGVGGKVGVLVFVHTVSLQGFTLEWKGFRELLTY
jgi:hypothetical protein